MRGDPPESPQSAADPENPAEELENEPLLPKPEVRAAQRRKRITARHWGVLVFACLLLFGNYYCYDIPAALNVPMRRSLGVPYGQWQWQLNVLYSVYSLPNIFLPFFGGLLVDRLGATATLSLFSTLCSAGQMLFSAGLSARRYPLMVAGRLVFGLGGESLEVAQATVTTEWFHGRGLAFALGMNVAFARIATALNDNASPWLARRFGEAEGTAVAAWVGAGVCLCSFASAVGLICLNTASSRQQAGIGGYATTADGADPSSDENSQEDDTVNLAQALQFPTRFWVLCLCTVCMYGAASPFFHICTDLFMDKWFPNDPQTAGMLMSIPDVMAAALSPVFGLAIDRVGRRGTLLPLGGVLLLATHGLLTFTMLHPAVAMVLMGLAYTLFAAVLWPCVPYLVRPDQIATGFGVLTVSLNIALAVFPLLVALVRSASVDDGHSGGGGWTLVGCFFLAMSALGTACAVAVRVLDAARGSVLEQSCRASQPSPTGSDASDASDASELDEEEESDGESPQSSPVRPTVRLPGRRRPGRRSRSVPPRKRGLLVPPANLNESESDSDDDGVALRVLGGAAAPAVLMPVPRHWRRPAHGRRLSRSHPQGGFMHPPDLEAAPDSARQVRIPSPGRWAA